MDGLLHGADENDNAEFEPVALLLSDSKDSENLANDAKLQLLYTSDKLNLRVGKYYSSTINQYRT